MNAKQRRGERRYIQGCWKTVPSNTKAWPIPEEAITRNDDGSWTIDMSKVLRMTHTGQ